MHICGIVSEYNPFHAGHEWHIAQTRIATGADLIVCAMSASFVQRGEPAVFDKWTRAACALLCGADAVVELPLLSAVQSAEGFAQGGIALLQALGATSISFGSETGYIRPLQHAAQALAEETEEYRNALKAHLNEGSSFPAARMKAARPDAADTLCSPNDILGVEYIKAILQSGAPITPYTVPRTGGAYHSADMSDAVPSATALRATMKNGDIEATLSAMPSACRGYMRAQLKAGLLPAFPESFDNALLFTLRRNGREYIRNLHEVSEGLENRVFEAVQSCASRDMLIGRIKTKRYTYTRISRILLYALLGITRDMVRCHNQTPLNHVRVLGVKDPAVLSALTSICRVPLVAGSIANSSYPSLDTAATDVWALSQRVPPFSNGYRDYTQKLLIASQL